MTEEQLYEALGRKQAVIEAQALAYSALLLELVRVLNGSVSPDRITVDLAAQTWTRAPLEGTNEEAKV